ncbi:MAG: hypothetical protein KC422_22030, partial [Trueperaceae bacterium]|nr:hypothetical protein [Trueperaceae bacterium]
MIGLLFVVLAVASAALSLFGSSFLATWSAINSLVSMVFAILFLVIGLIVWAIKNFYIKPSANEAYVMTGMGGRRVLIDQGGLFIPIVQQMVPVSLETMKLDVERIGQDALITKDNLRVDVRAEFYIKVLPDQDDVINAARSLGEKSVNAESVSNLVFEKLVSALRSVAATKDLVQIHAQRDEFAVGVQTLVTTDLEQNGLTLESVTISRFDQTNQDMLSDSNIFDAQGKRKITEITQSALVERNRIEQEALREITMKNVHTRKETLELEREQAEAEAAQQSTIARARSERSREAETYSIEQQRQVEEARIAQEEAVKRRSLERDREIIARQKELETADVERKKAVDIAERLREVEIADAERSRAEAEKNFLEAKAAREAAEQEVVTVKSVAEAERAAKTKLIAAQQQIDEDRIRQETDAEVEAFAQVKRAEAIQDAAKLEAQAALTKAQAEAEAKERLAKGETALKRIDVDIERERVNVEQARVAVEREALENREQFSQAAIEFEVQKLRIEASRDVQIEMAKA